MDDRSQGGSQRLFFAVWPGTSVRQVIGSLAREIARGAGGRPVAADHIHLTLAFLGDQAADRVPTLQQVGESIKASAFVLALDEVGCFRRTGITWLGAGAAQPGLDALHGELAVALERSGFATDERPYAAHVTLARRSKSSLQRRLSEPVAWPVSSFALVASDLGSGAPTYRTLADWRLADA